MPRKALSFAILSGLLAACGVPPRAAPALPCPVREKVVTPPPPQVAPTACQVIEAHQEEVLGQIARERPEAFSRKVESHEPLLDASLYRGCQRAKSGTIGMVPVRVETEGLVTLRAMLVDGSGKPHYSQQIRVAEPGSWELLEAEREALVLVRGTDYSRCRYGHPCTSSNVYLLRFSEGEPILSPLAERWLGTTSALPSSDEDGPLPLQQVFKSRGPDLELATFHFQWPSLRLGDTLIEGVEANVEVDEGLRLKPETLLVECKEEDRVSSGTSLWKSAECQRLHGVSTAVVVAALRARCERVLRDVSKGKDPSGRDAELCVDSPDRPWLYLDDAEQRTKPRPAVHLAPEVSALLARIGPALVAPKKARGAGVD